MKDLSRVEQQLESILWWLSLPLLALAVYHKNWWPVVLFMILAMVLERTAERRLQQRPQGDA